MVTPGGEKTGKGIRDQLKVSAPAKDAKDVRNERLAAVGSFFIGSKDVVPPRKGYIRGQWSNGYGKKQMSTKGHTTTAVPDMSTPRPPPAGEGANIAGTRR